MRLTVIESPYAGKTPADVEANVNYARACMRDALARNEAPLASHLLYTQPGILDDNHPLQRKLGIDAGFEWAQMACLITFYTDRGWSTGMLEALAYDQIHGLPYEFRAILGEVKQPPALTDATI